MPAYTLTPVSLNATREASAVLNYLYSFYNAAYNGCIVGQNCGMGEGAVQGYQRFIVALEQKTGKWVGDIDVDYEYTPIQTLDQLKKVNAILIDQWKNGGLVSVTYCPGNPWTNGGEPQNNTGKENLSLLITPGNSYYTQWTARIARIADALTQLRDSGVVVLFRPLQECTNSNFWYGAKDTTQWIAVYRHMFNYFTKDRKLNNLLWVFAPLGTVRGYYPGDTYVDIVAGTGYSSDLLNNAGYADYAKYNKPIGFSEWGQWGVYDIDNRLYLTRVRSSYTKLSYWVTWHTWDPNMLVAIVDNRYAYELMNDSTIITRDKITWKKFLSPILERAPGSNHPEDFLWVQDKGSFLLFDSFGHSPKSIEFFLPDGRSLFFKENSTGAFTISKTNLASGLYLVKLNHRTAKTVLITK